MKILMYIHSATGHTMQVAQLLEEKYKKQGHKVEIKSIVALNDREENPDNIKLIQCPPLEEADIYIFAAPVRRFQLSPVMRAYLAWLPSLKDRQIYCFVTQFFPFKSMGGTNALKQFVGILESKKAQMKGHIDINWSVSKKRQRLIHEILDEFII